MDVETEDNLDQVLLKLAFSLKQQGQLAEERLIRRYRQDSADPTCNPDLSLQQIWLNHSVRRWSPQIEAIVISQLDKSDPIPTDAAHLLERFGSKDSEPALWTRLEKWHRAEVRQTVRL